MYRRPQAIGAILGVAALAHDITERATSWEGDFPSESEVTFALPLAPELLERLERERQGADFLLLIYPRGLVEMTTVQIVTPGTAEPSPKLTTMYLRGSEHITLLVPRSHWADLLEAAGIDCAAWAVQGPLATPEARAAVPLLQQARRHLVLGDYSSAGTYARKAFETIAEVIAPLPPDKDPSTPVGKRVQWLAWTAQRLCHPAAHAGSDPSFGRAEAMLAIQVVAALVTYADTRGSDTDTQVEGDGATTSSDVAGATPTT